MDSELYDFEEDLVDGRLSIPIFLIIVSALGVGFFKNVVFGVYIFWLTLPLVGATIARNWNTDIRENRVADAMPYQNARSGVLFTFFLLLPPSYLYTNSIPKAAIIAVGALVGHALVVATMLFWGGVDRHDIVATTDPETSDPKIYLTERDYIDRVEEVALSRTPDDDSPVYYEI